MENIKDLAGFAVIPNRDRKRISYNYDVISPDGKVIKSNQNEDFIVLDEEITEKINELWKLVEDKMNGIER